MNAAELPIPEFPHLQKFGVQVDPWVERIDPVFEAFTDIGSVDWSQPYDDPRCIGERRRFELHIHGQIPSDKVERFNGDTRWNVVLTLDERDLDGTYMHLADVVRVKAECAELRALDLLGELPEAQSA